jgi:hypothetical protein
VDTEAGCEAIFPRLTGECGFYFRRHQATRIMESEQLQNFNERLSQWVANQGFWFQIRYSMSGSGVQGRAMFHLLRIGFRLLVFLLLVALGLWIFLLKRIDSDSFAEMMRKNLQTGLSAAELEIPDPSRSQGQLEISRLVAEGAEDTFFTSIEARNIRCKMSLVDGLIGVWKPGIISIARLDLDLRAGANDAGSARKFAESLFRKSEKIEIRTFEVADATLRWGFSEPTQGSIESSFMKVLRTETGWRLNFKGGVFNQNWLRNLEIVNLVAVCEPDGVFFEKAQLRHKTGTVDFSGLRVRGGELPQVEGTAKIRNLSLDDILPATFRTFVEGSISGDFRVFGSTNSADGIGFEGQVVMGGDDSISIRERIRLLKALSDVDYSRNYHRVDFRSGSFQLKSSRGGLEISDLKLKAEDLKVGAGSGDSKAGNLKVEPLLFTLEGNMIVRQPTEEEIQIDLQKGLGMSRSSIFGSEDAAAEEEELRKRESDFAMKRAAQEAKRVQDGLQSADSLSLTDRLGLGLQMRHLRNQASERMSRMLRYEGMFEITIPGDAFERAPRLQTLYPVDGKTGRIPMRVPIEGQLWEVTLKQAEDLYQQGQR